MLEKNKQVLDQFIETMKKQYDGTFKEWKEEEKLLKMWLECKKVLHLTLKEPSEIISDCYAFGVPTNTSMVLLKDGRVCNIPKSRIVKIEYDTEVGLLLLQKCFEKDKTIRDNEIEEQLEAFYRRTVGSIVSTKELSP